MASEPVSSQETLPWPGTEVPESPESQAIAIDSDGEQADEVVDIPVTEFAQRLEELAETVAAMGQDSASWVMFCRTHITNQTLKADVYEFQYECILRYSYLAELLQDPDQPSCDARRPMLVVAQSFVDDLNHQYVILQAVMLTAINRASGSVSDHPEGQ